MKMRKNGGGLIIGERDAAMKEVDGRVRAIRRGNNGEKVLKVKEYWNIKYRRSKNVK